MKNKKMKVVLTDTFIKSAIKLFSNSPRYLIPRKIQDWKLELKWGYQRIVKGYDDRATWELDFWLSDNLPKIIREMKSFVHGYPASNPFQKKRKGDIQSMKEWKGILEQIAKGFESAGKIGNNEYMKKVKLRKPIKDMFGKDSYTDYKFDKKAYNKMKKDFDEGIKLFHKHFFSLWD